MAVGLEIRASGRDDLAAIEALYPAAFPDEDLVPLVRELVDDTDIAVSLVGMLGGTLAGHALFTKCGVTGADADVALLGPLAVAPASQGQGYGSALVRDGLRRLEAAGCDRVMVLGDPAYYARFGFQLESSVRPPYPLPAEWEGAWQSRRLSRPATSLSGDLSVPPPWRDHALWAP